MQPVLIKKHFSLQTKWKKIGRQDGNAQRRIGRISGTMSTFAPARPDHRSHCSAPG